MRKEFREPELKRIELRLEERIAVSGEIPGMTGGFTTRQFGEPGGTCHILVVSTEIKVENLPGCTDSDIWECFNLEYGISEEAAKSYYEIGQ